jgi:hypothetical protein
MQPCCKNHFHSISKGFDYYLMIFFCGFVFLLIFIFSFFYSFPLFAFADRYAYWLDKPSVFKTIYGQLYLIAFVSGVLFRYNKNLSISLVVLTMMTLLLFSNKFSAYIQCLYLYCVPVILGENLNLSGQFKFFLSFSVTMILGLTVFVYIVIYGKDEFSLYFSIVDRIILQGHIFWGAINLYPNCFFVDFHNFINEIMAICGMADELYGMQKLMVNVSGDIGLLRISQGANFTMAYPATVYMFSGILGIYVFQIFFVLVFSFVLKLIYKNLMQNRFMCLIPLGKVFNDLCGFFGIGNIDILFGSKMLIYFLSYLFMVYLYRRFDPATRLSGLIHSKLQKAQCFYKVIIF